MDFFEQHFDPFFELLVDSCWEFAWSGPKDVVWLCSVELHVFPIAAREPTSERGPEHADVIDSSGSCADDPSGGLNADEFAAAQGFDRVTEYLCVAVAVLIAQNDDRFRPGRIDHPIVRVTDATAPRDGNGVFGLGQGSQKVVGRRSASVVSDIDHQPLFAITDVVKLLFEFQEARFVHGLDVQIPKLAIGQSLDHLTVVL